MLTPTKKLDVVLKWMVDNANRFWTTEDIIQEPSYRPLLNEIDIQLLHMILERLVKDGNTSLDETKRTYQYMIGEPETKVVWLYKVSFDGLIFYERGGYKRQQEVENEKFVALQQEKDLINEQIKTTIQSNKAAKKTAVWNIRLFWATFATAVAALITPTLPYLNDKEKDSLKMEIQAKSKQIEQLQKQLSTTLKSLPIHKADTTQNQSPHP